ncbi:type II secretion system protein [Chloroflexota bacterium]
MRNYGSKYIILPEAKQKGFTLIELLIVVAILGALAAVVIPNVGRFIGEGETEAQETEFSNIQSAVHAMMVDNEIATLSNPVEAPENRTNDMSNFPDTSICGFAKIRDIEGNAYVGSADKDGYILFGHDRIADSDNSTDLSNYVTTSTTTYWYTTDARGTVTQYDTAP